MGLNCLIIFFFFLFQISVICQVISGILSESGEKQFGQTVLGINKKEATPQINENKIGHFFSPLPHIATTSF